MWTAPLVCSLKEGREREVDILGKDIVETAEMMVFDLVFVIRISEVTADFPDEWFEFVLQTVLAHVPEDEDLFGIGLEVGPQIMMIRDDDLAVEIFCHPEDIAGSHLVGDASRVFAIGTESDIDLVFVSVFCVHVSKVGVTGILKEYFKDLL